jgi:asparagine synthase (glutamine-hydrolysing)
MTDKLTSWNMCGIVALADTRLSTDELTILGRRMLEITQHRGPDHQGSAVEPPVFLGHNRLSIIDLSSASHQPMTRRGASITFNGEIYNYVELRAELERMGEVFSTSGDTEVILAAYHRWGKKCVERFIGMWAFAIWDDQKQLLFCSRDRFGIKPFHYAEHDGRLHIASEIKALRLSPLFHGSLNADQVARGLYLGFMHHWEETYYHDVKALPAAHNLTWQNGSVHIWQFAHLDTHTESPLPFDDHAEQFRNVFIDSIRLTSRRDVPMGVCLSGGLDSTSIASALAMATDENQVRTFTAFYTGKGDVDERPYIDHVLKAYPQIDAHYISPTDTDVREALDRIVWMMDAPLPSSSYISQYFVMQLAAQHGVKVVLDGQGSDEIMGGYMHSLYRVIADLFRKGAFIDGTKEWRAHGQRQHYGFGKQLDVLAKSLITVIRDESSLYRLELARTYPWVMKRSAKDVPLHLEMPSGTRLNAFLYNLIHVTLLPTLLHTEDLNSMAFSIESRVPFLDHRLVQLCFSLPNDHKVHRGETKRVLRKAMRGIVPDPVLDRKDKTGFITPGHTKWLRGDLSYLLDGHWNEVEEFIHPTEVQRLISEFKRGSNKNALFLWRLAMLRLFLSSSSMR